MPAVGRFNIPAMPHPYRSPVDPNRRYAVPATLVTVLAGVLALGWVLTARRVPRVRSIRVADVELSVPETWQRNDPASRPSQLDVAVAFEEPAEGGRTLLIAGVRDRSVRAPAVVLDNALSWLVDEPTRSELRRTQPALSLRVGSLTGLWYSGLIVGEATVTLHQIAVFTEDARRYWMLHLRDTATPQAEALEEAIQRDGRLMAELFAGTAGLNLRDAAEPDGSAADLGAGVARLLQLSQLRGRVPVDGFRGEPIDLIPRIGPRQTVLFGGDAGVQVLRVRGTVDAGLTDPSHPLSPLQLLAHEFLQVQGRLPRPPELLETRVLGVPAWRTTFAQPDALLIRQLWYVQVGGGLGLLLELVGEPGGIERSQQWIPDVVRAIGSGVDQGPRGEPAGNTFEEAVARGKALTGRQLESLLSSSREAWGYYLVEADSTPIGCQVEQLLPVEGSEAGPVQGIERTLLVGSRLLEVDQRWSVARDGGSFSVVTIQAAREGDGPIAPLRFERLQLGEGVLTLERVIGDQVEKVWALPSPPAYVLPMLRTTWPVQGADASGPALVWMSRGNRPPQPHWVQALAPAAGVQGEGTAEPVIELLVRPMMSLDPERVIVDSRGQMLRYQTGPAGRIAGGNRTTLRRVSREELVAAIPAVEPELERWQSDQQP